ncbi:hypothetical protein Q7P37_005122 [Cladosporium fusiforme]
MFAQPYPGLGLEPYRAQHRRIPGRQGQIYIPITHRYQNIRGLGCGGEGIVFLARPINRGGELRVLKIIRHASPFQPPPEAYMHDVVGAHRNIVKMFEVEYNYVSRTALISLEYASGGDLRGQLAHWSSQGIQAPAAVVLHAMAQIGEALAWVHGSWVRQRDNSYLIASAPHAATVHSDIKPQNILIRAQGHRDELPDFVLADFGLSFRPSHAQRHGQGTDGFYAPENLFHNQPITAKSDINAYGITMLCICQGHRAGLFPCGQNPARISVPYHLRGLGITRLLQACLIPNPNRREKTRPYGDDNTAESQLSSKFGESAGQLLHVTGSIQIRGIKMKTVYNLPLMASIGQLDTSLNTGYSTVRKFDSREGTVQLVRSRRSGKLRIIKSVRHHDLRKPPHEALILSRLSQQHPNIIRIYAAELNAHLGTMLFEYCDGGDLFGQSKKFDSLGIPTPVLFALHLWCSLGDALAFLHHGLMYDRHSNTYRKICDSPSIIHSDIKDDNIYLRHDGNSLPTVVLADFGMACEQGSYRGGCEAFLPPECRFTKSPRATNKSDIYSLGVTMMSVLNRKSGLWPVLTDPKKVEIHIEYMGLGMTTCLKSMLAINPNNRGDFSGTQGLGLLSQISKFRKERDRMLALGVRIHRSLWKST